MLDTTADRLAQDDGVKLATLTTSAGLVALAENAQKRGSNRQANIAALSKMLDPNGVHVLAWHFMHNEIEWRTIWMVKVSDSLVPASLQLDVSFTAFTALTRSIRVKSATAEAA